LRRPGPGFSARVVRCVQNCIRPDANDKFGGRRACFGGSAPLVSDPCAHG
jgi:hypothetical protein